jgi:radical SAM family RiPP maturation amino acid epimerase
MPSPLKDIFYYTHENAALWKEILQITQDILGVFAGASVCYWATEPFDNPDYEKFCLDFASVHGFFPYTSTIKHVEDPARIRNFLRLSKEHGRIHHRFSIVSLPVLRKLYQEFTAEELASIQLTLNNRESAALYSNTGRARELYKKETTKNKIYPEGTSACLSGFLVNMVNRTIKLITPCNPSEKWPFGYMVYEETSFHTACDFKDRITTMIETYMPLSPGSDNIVAFRPDLKFRTFEDGFEVSTKFMTRTFCNAPIVKEVGKIVNKGKHTLQEIVDMFEIYCLPLDYIPETIQKMLQSGILQEPLINPNANL